MVKGLIINKFRGDKTILDPGIAILEAKSGIDVVGVAPYLHIDVEDEDSLSERSGVSWKSEQVSDPDRHCSDPPASYFKLYRPERDGNHSRASRVRYVKERAASSKIRI